MANLLDVITGLLAKVPGTKANERFLRLEKIRDNWQTIGDMNSSTQAEQRVAVSMSWEALLYIRPSGRLNFSDDIFDAVNYRLEDCNAKYSDVRSDGQKDFGTPLGVGYESLLCIGYCKNLQGNAQAIGRSLLSVMRDGNTIGKVQVVNDDIVSIAIQNGLTDYSKLPAMNQDNQLLLLRLHPWLLDYENFATIKQPCEIVANMAISRDARNVLLLESPSDTQLMQAIEQSPKLWPQILEINGLLIDKIDSPSEELQVIAVTQNPKAFMLIKQPCEEARVIAADNVVDKKSFASIERELNGAKDRLSQVEGDLKERTRERDAAKSDAERWYRRG